MATLAERDETGTLVAGEGEVEEVGRRTRTAKVFRLPDAPDGRRRFRIGAQVGPVHYRQDPWNEGEEWKEIDLAVRPTPDLPWNGACETNGYQVRFWDFREVAGRTVRCAAQYRRGGRWLAMAPLGLLWANAAGQVEALALPQIVGATVNNANPHLSTITWRGAFGEGLDFRYALGPDLFWKSLIIQSRDSLPPPTIGRTGLRLVLVMALAWDGEVAPGNGFAEGVTTGDLEAALEDADAPPDEELVDPEAFPWRGAGREYEYWWCQRPLARDSGDPEQVVPVAWRLRRRGNRVLALFSVPAAALAKAVYPVEIDPAIAEEAVAANLDDVFENSSGVWDGNTLEWQNTYNPNAVGLRFTTVPLPQGCTIDSATLSVYVLTQDDPRSYIYCQAADDAAQFTTTAGDVLGRPLTSASVYWNANNIGTGWKTSPDVSAPVQEVVNRSGWVSNNDLAFITRSNSTTYLLRTNSKNNAYPAKFNCSYTEATPAAGNALFMAGD